MKSKGKDWGKRKIKVQYVWYKILCKIMYLYELESHEWSWWSIKCFLFNFSALFSTFFLSNEYVIFIWRGKTYFYCEANSLDTCYILGITLDAGCTLVVGGLVMDLRMWELILMLPRFQSYTAPHSPNPLCFIWRR